VYRVGSLLITAVVAAGCTANQSSRVPLALNNIAMLEMERTTSLLKKRDIASLSCRKSGYGRQSPEHRQCMSALLARDLQRTRERIDRMAQQSAQRHGVCMSQKTLSIGRCIEI
jgi:hypothetical protein